MNINSPKGSQKQDQSPSKDVRSKLAKATELESRYLSATSASPSLKNESNIQMFRTKLCEQFADILLLDPAYAARKDISGRLWRSCFHGRVQELRDRIAKEKTKLKKIQQKSKTGPDEDAERHQQALVENLDRLLDTFLKESVGLYEYLIDQYQGKLLPPISSQTSPTPTERGLSMDGVVPILHRFFIHLGDLLRYSSSYAGAETAYLKAARLAPGRGNPYNQLAVIGQIKDTHVPQPVVVLYWYCRSLLATEDPFPTAAANLERFFTLNNKEASKRNANDENAQITSTTVGLNREKARALRAVMNRAFLQAFTDFHGQLFLATKSTTQVETKPTSVDINNTESLFSQLDWLLGESAFSDALLNKMVAIMASSLWSILYAEHTVKDEYAIIAVTFILEFGVHLSQSFLPVLDKLLGKTVSQGSNGGLISVRLFTPILFLCEFISSLWLKNDRFKILWQSNTAVDERVRECRQTYHQFRALFWSKITQIANILVSSNYFQTLHQNSDTFRPDLDTSDSSRPLDFEEMRGFKPFETFVSHADILSPEEAVTALELDASALSQSNNVPLTSQTTSSSSNKGVKRGDTEAEFNVKINRFHLFALRHTGLELQVGPEGLFSLKQEEDLTPEVNSYHHVTNMDLDNTGKIDDNIYTGATQTMQAVEEDDAGDHVVYDTSALSLPEDFEQNDCPLSLIPANLLDSTLLMADNRKEPHLKPSDLMPISKNIGDTNFSALDSNVVKSHSSTSLEMAAKVTVRPPPGFQHLNCNQSLLVGESLGEVNPKSLPLTATNLLHTPSYDQTSFQLNALYNTNNPFFVPMPPLGRDNISLLQSHAPDFSFHSFQFSDYAKLPQSIEPNSRFIQFFDTGDASTSQRDDIAGPDISLFTRNPFA